MNKLNVLVVFILKDHKKLLQLKNIFFTKMSSLKVLVSETNLHDIKCFYVTIYLEEHSTPIFNLLFISNDDVTPEMWKSVMI